MAAGVIFMQWDSYAGGPDGSPFFAENPLTFNTRQERLHRLTAGDRLWLVSRCPADGQYYFTCALRIAQLIRNPPASDLAARFGEYAILADRSESHDLGRRFPAEALLRAFTFETGRPIKYGASIGQSLQTLRLLDPADERILDAALADLAKADAVPLAGIAGPWTKCDSVFADYFLKNWSSRHEPLAFLLYDPPPALRAGSPVFIHSDKNLRLLARFREAQFVAGYKPTIEPDERLAERERVWQTNRAGTVDPPTKEEFDKFWAAQHGVHSGNRRAMNRAPGDPLRLQTSRRDGRFPEQQERARLLDGRVWPRNLKTAGVGSAGHWGLIQRGTTFPRTIRQFPVGSRGNGC
jgi:hypothetical protein